MGDEQHAFEFFMSWGIRFTGLHKILTLGGERDRVDGAGSFPPCSTGILQRATLLQGRPGTHQVEEHFTQVSPAAIGLSAVHAGYVHHFHKEPFVNVEILRRE